MANRGERERAVGPGNNNLVSHVLHQGMGYQTARGAIGAVKGPAVLWIRNGKSAV